MNAALPPPFAKALRLCREIDSIRPGAQALIAGGAVRDYIMGRPCDDVDIAHNLPLDVIKEHFNSEGVGQGEKFGVSVATFEGERFELTCFRKDGLYIDGRRPDSVTTVSDFKEDSARRDFTINALGMDSSGQIIDHWGGVADIKNRTIRCVGDALDRFSEDPARMFRAIRFAAAFDFDLDPATESGIRAFAIRSRDVANERITKELLKCADSGPILADFISLADKTQLLPHFLPEIAAMKEFKHNPAHHPEGGVFEHTLAALRVSRESDPIRNTAVLLHDIGKPKTFKMSDKGQPTYFGHEEAGARMIPEIAKRMKLTNDMRDVCVSVARHHGLMHRLGELRHKKKVDFWTIPNFEEVKIASMADRRCRLHAHNEGQMTEEFAAFDRELAYLGTREEFTSRLKSLAGGDVIKEAAPNAKGKEVGILQEQTRDWLIDQRLNVTPEQAKKTISSLHRGMSRQGR